jgi:hypothetical protein
VVNRWSSCSQRGVWHCYRGNMYSYFSELKQIRRSSCSAFPLLWWGCAYLGL